MTKKRYVPREGRKEVSSLDSQVSRDSAAVILPISLITVPANIRSRIENIEELAASIREHGLLQPLVVAKAAGGFELVAGQRRLAALKVIGAAEAPVRIVGADADQIAVLRLIENLQRDELSAWDTCRAVAALLPMFDSQRELAKAIGKTDGYVSKCLAVVESEPEVERVQLLSLRELFQTVPKKDRKRSGAVAGGRYVSGAIQFRDHGDSFNLRVNFDPVRTPPESREKIIVTLQEIISRLRSR